MRQLQPLTGYKSLVLHNHIDTMWWPTPISVGYIFLHRFRNNYSEFHANHRLMISDPLEMNRIRFADDMSGVLCIPEQKSWKRLNVILKIRSERYERFIITQCILDINVCISVCSYFPSFMPNNPNLFPFSLAWMMDKLIGDINRLASPDQHSALIGNTARFCWLTRQTWATRSLGLKGSPNYFSLDYASLSDILRFLSHEAQKSSHRCQSYDSFPVRRHPVSERHGPDAYGVRAVYSFERNEWRNSKWWTRKSHELQISNLAVRFPPFPGSKLHGIIYYNIKRLVRKWLMFPAVFFAYVIWYEQCQS